ncbi:MAG TPA: hypothetical protein VGG54_16940 [Trebonia sp.]|jgi:hypothetical protein
MTDGGAAFEPGRGEPPFRPRGAYVGHEVFGHGDGAVLVDPEVARDLRSAAESASQERRIAGGLLYGRMLADDEGKYLVIDGFLEAGPGENPGDRTSREGRDSFTLSDADLELLREDATRMYPAALEVGWWRTLAGQGEFSPRDFETQRELVGPGGAGLLVFGEGLEWGTAYLGPDGRVPDSARSFIPVPRPATEAPLVPTRELGLVPGTVLEPDGDLEPDSAGDLEPDPEPAAATAPGTSLAPRRPALTPAPRPTAPRAISPVPVPSQEWGVKPSYPSYVGAKTPTDVKIVVGALVVTAIVAATIIGVLASNALVAVIVAVVGLLAIGGFLWMSRL